MKKPIALTVSAAILFNSLSVAFASDLKAGEQALNQVEKTLNNKQLMEMLEAADGKTSQELTAALAEVRGLMKKLNDISSVNESDRILRYANRMQVVLVALTAYTMHAHLKSVETNRAVLALSTASIALNTFINHYKESRKVDSATLSQIVFDTSRELSKSGQLSPELQQMTGSLNQISSTLLENQGQLANLVSNLNGGQDVALVVSFGYLLLHMVYPKLAKETDGFLKNVLPKIQQGVQKTTDAVKKPVAYGATGATGVPDILSMTIGLSSEQSQKLILSTLINLDTAANKLEAEIKMREAKQKK